MSLSLIIRQARRYAPHRIGLQGSLLKHSLIPLSLLRETLPQRGVVLDLGCGEGMLANLVAASLPGLRVHGVDLNEEKVELANRMAEANSRFERADVLSLAFEGAAAAIINDVLHHRPTEQQVRFLKKTAGFLDAHGVLVLKEVDALDRPDRTWTSFWDSRLYPADRLNFHNVQEWRETLFDAGFEVLGTRRLRHPWPASRTVFVCRRLSSHAPRPTMIPAQAPEAAAKVLVTGGTGFLGRHLVRHLSLHGVAGRKADVTVLTRGRARLPSELIGSCRVLVADIRSLPSESQAITEAEYVFHLAAEKDFFGRQKVFDDNVDGTRALLKSLAASTRLKALVFASSIGAIDRIPNDPCRSPLNEESAARPCSNYGRAKLECERLVKESSLPAAILRIPWCYGPGMTPSTHIRALTDMVRRGKLVTRFNWPGRVSVLEAGECAKALCFLAGKAETPGKTYLVSDGEPISFGALFQEMGRLVGRPAGAIEIPRWARRAASRVRRFLPFTLRSLVVDLLWADGGKLTQLGFTADPRKPNFLLPLLRHMGQETHPSLHRSKALVSGAASGLGYALSLQLAASGRSVVMVDRDPRVAELAAAIPGAQACLADLSQEEGISKVEQLLGSPEISWAANCAGVGIRAKAGAMDSRRLGALLGLNVDALTRLSEAAIRNFSAAGEGVLVNVASSAAFQPLPGMAAYAASKAYVLSFSEAIGGEQPSSSISVLAICPSGIDTHFQQAAGVRKLPGEKLLAPHEVAGDILRASVHGGSRTLFIGRRTFLMAALARLLPRATAVRLWRELLGSYR